MINQQITKLIYFYPRNSQRIQQPERSKMITEMPEESSRLRQSAKDNTDKKGEPVQTKSRPRSGSWGGAYESDEEIKV